MGGLHGVRPESRQFCRDVLLGSSLVVHAFLCQHLLSPPHRDPAHWPGDAICLQRKGPCGPAGDRLFPGGDGRAGEARIPSRPEHVRAGDDPRDAGWCGGEPAGRATSLARLPPRRLVKGRPGSGGDRCPRCRCRAGAGEDQYLQASREWQPGAGVQIHGTGDGRWHEHARRGDLQLAQCGVDADPRAAAAGCRVLSPGR